MKAIHPTYGEVEILRQVDKEHSLCRLSTGVELELTTVWLKPIPKDKPDGKPA